MQTTITVCYCTALLSLAAIIHKLFNVSCENWQYQHHKSIYNINSMSAPAVSSSG